MRILQVPEVSIPQPAAAAAQAVSPSSRESERVNALEKAAKAILQKIQSLEEKIKELETQPPKAAQTAAPVTVASPVAAAVTPPTPAVVVPAAVPPPAFSSTPVTIDPDALKKGLLTKMWKYLNDGG